MFFSTLINEDLILSSNLKRPAKIESLQSCIKFLHFYCSSSNTIEGVNLNGLPDEYIPNDFYESESNLHSSVYTLTKRFSFGEIICFAQKQDLYKEYSLPEACYLIKAIIENHENRRGHEIFIILQNKSIDGTPTISVGYTMQSTFKINYFEMYADMVCQIGDSIIF